MNLLRWADEWRRDLRFGLRSLLGTPVWTTAVVLTLASGIALTTAMFSIMYGVLVRQLPYHDPQKVVAIWLSSTKLPRFNVSPSFWRDWRAQATSLEDISLTRPVANFNLTGSGDAERLQGARTSWNMAAVLGVQPLVGRWFTEEETWRDANVAVLSYSLWERRFAKDPALVGGTIRLNDTAFEVIGVMPASYRYPTRDFELWTPLFIPAETYQSGVDNSYRSVARLKPGVTIERARAELARITKQLSAKYPAVMGSAGETTAIVEPLLV